MDIVRIDTKLQEVSNLLHDTLPFISTLSNPCHDGTSATVSKIRVCKEKNAVYHEDTSSTKKYSFDTLFGVSSTQEDIFAYVYGKFAMACTGTTVLFVAIGSSGSGKPFTLVGENNEICTSDGDIGLIGRTSQQKLNELRNGEKLYTSSCDLLESMIYLEGNDP